MPTPSGWLVNPEKRLILFFIRDPKSLIRTPKVITQIWPSTEKGIPTTIKNTRTMDLKGAIETWNELLSNSWELVQQQINDNVA